MVGGGSIAIDESRKAPRRLLEEGGRRVGFGGRLIFAVDENNMMT